MRIDIIFDTICPWCYIGKKRLETSLADVAIDDLEIQWNAFLLNPEMPTEGMEPGEYARTKFGGEARARRVHSAIKRTGEAEGIDFRLHRISRVPNTIDSHRLIRFAEREGRADEVVEAVFKSYFLEGHDIGRRSTLTEIGARIGLDVTELTQYLAGNDDRTEVLEQNIRAHRLGISGVPAFIIDSQFSLSGAQDPLAIRRLLDVAREKRREMFDAGDQLSGSQS
ncbi:MAG: DsbA family oxidoreductase [Pseudomonadota bacterium]|nr:DsbA family oxidoreductase [Pseudomonadota bacterium]